METIQLHQPNFLARQIGILKGHSGHVTKICVSPVNPDIVVSASRDKSILIWNVYTRNGEMHGQLKKSLLGHNHFVSDCVLSRDGDYLISASWDRTLRLWDVNQTKSRNTFNGHTNDVTCVDFSMDNRQIVSGSRDRTIRLWNTLGVQKYVFLENNHSDCISTVLTTPQSSPLTFISAARDGLVKVWSMNPPVCIKTYKGHSNAINSLSICRDSSFIASGSKDNSINLWKFQSDEFAKKFNANGIVSCLSFNPNFLILAASVEHQVLLYNIGTQKLYQNVDPLDFKNIKKKPKVTTLTWSKDGKMLYVGYNDSYIRIFILYAEQSNH